MRKRTAETALFSYYHLSIHFIPFYSYANTENLILSRKLPFCFRVRIWVLPASIRVSVIISDFCLRVYTIRQNNPRTEIRTLTNVKMPLKAHGNNVTLESMYCQKCRVYGLCRLSVSVSAGEGDTLTKYDNIPQIQHNSQDLSLCKPVIFSQQTKYYIFILKIKLGHNRTIFHLNY